MTAIEHALAFCGVCPLSEVFRLSPPMIRLCLRFRIRLWVSELRRGCQKVVNGAPV